MVGTRDDFYDVRLWSVTGRCLFQEDGFSIFIAKEEKEVEGVGFGRGINCLVDSI